MEEKQDRLYTLKKAQSHEKDNNKYDTPAGGIYLDRDRRRLRGTSFKTPSPEKRHRGGQG